ncbi:formate transporter FocA [Shewanella intestini]|nr:MULTISPECIES: formate transporter FocA [Shewanella]
MLNLNQTDAIKKTVEEKKNSMVETASQYGLAKVEKTPVQSFILSIFAGAFIAVAFVFYITVTNGSDVGWGLTRFIGGLAFSMGLMLVIGAGAELFTSTVLTTVAWANKKIGFKAQIQCWARVYVGNMVGALLMVWLIMSAGMFDLNHGQWGLSALNIAQHKLHHTWGQAFALGILCNMMVCLGIWMTFATKDVLTKCMLVMLPVAMFVSSGFEHSVANMFMVPFGISIAEFAPASFWSAINLDPVQFADLTITNFLFNNLIPVTLGNIVGGGVIVGLGHWLSGNSQAVSKVAEQNPQAANDKVND